MSVKKSFRTALESFLLKLESNSDSALLEAEQEVESFPLIPLLRARGLGTRFYWRDKNAKNEILALGTAWSGQSLDSVPALFQRLRVYGGMRFSPTAQREFPQKNSQDPTWSDFPGSFFFVPALEIRKASDSTRVFLRAQQEHAKEFAKQLRELLTDHSPPSHLSPCIETQYHPDRLNWSSAFNRVQESIRQGDLQKTVLAREVRFTFASRPDEAAVFARLQENAPTFHSFFFSPEHGEAFFGASPERLYRREGSRIWVDAIAGTRKRSPHPKEDQALTNELRDSAKDLLEHRFVKDWICERLNRFAANVRVTTEEQVLKLPKVQHLYSQIEAELLGAVPDSKILSELHPTPALAGFPVLRSLHQIERLETFDRGWYGGVLGYAEPESAEFTVSIRSARTQGNSVLAYSGVGIVSGSDVAHEWEELNLKLATMTDALGISKENSKDSFI